MGVKVLRGGSGNQFDPDVVSHFLRIAMPYPVGHPVTLADGVTGVVARVDPTIPERPVVRHRDDSGRLIEETLHIVDGVVAAAEPTAVR